MLIGRKDELADLEEEWESGKFAMPVVYGRRRVGKTAILRRFSEDKDAIFFTAAGDMETNVAILGQLMLEAHIPSSGERIDLMLTDIFRAAKERRILFIIDEYPYLAQSVRGTSSVLQRLIDMNQEDSRLFLVLCGSSMSFMKKHVLGYESPLFGRRTTQIFMRPFTLFESLDVLSDGDFERACEIYGLVGGTPPYLLKMDPAASLTENLVKGFLSPSRYLFEEARSLLKQELREPDIYETLLEIIGPKELKPQEIADRMFPFDVSRVACLKMLDDLEDIGILEKVSSWGDKNKILWRMGDEYFRFWHTFIPKLSMLIAKRRSETAASIIERSYSEYMGKTFERICGQWLEREGILGRFPAEMMKIGKWWGTDNKTRSQAEIDIVSMDTSGNMFFGECKWRDRPMQAGDIDKLVHRANLVPGARDCERAYYLFSKAGFTPDAVERARKVEGCRLVSLADMAATARMTDVPATGELSPNL